MATPINKNPRRYNRFSDEFLVGMNITSVTVMKSDRVPRFSDVSVVEVDDPTATACMP